MDNELQAGYTQAQEALKKLEKLLLQYNDQLPKDPRRMGASMLLSETSRILQIQRRKNSNDKSS